MRLTVVGCSGSLPGPDSAASCYLVEGGGTRLVLDLGNGALGALQRLVDPLDVDAVALSHLHPDHCLDMCGLYVLRRYGPRRPAERLPVWGPGGTGPRLARAYDLPPEPGMSVDLDVRPYPPGGGAFEVGALVVRTARVRHPVEAYALRVEHGGRALVYSGDTAATPALVDLARGADVLLCEASWAVGQSSSEGVHMTGAEAGEHATAAGVGRLVVTHVPPWNDPADAVAEARTTYGGAVVPAEAGLVLEV